MSNYHYLHLPLRRVKSTHFVSPPPIWLARFQIIQPSVCIKRHGQYYPNDHFQQLYAGFQNIAVNCCSDAERYGSLDILNKLQPMSRWIHAVIYAKSTNGVSDKQSVRLCVANSTAHPIIQLDDVCDDVYFIASMMLYSSKWIKNAIVCHKIFLYVHDECGGIPPTDPNFWLNLYEFRSKSVAVMFRAAWGIELYVPVDSHVTHVLTELKLTNGKSPDEICFQLNQFFPTDWKINFNDYVGSISQCLHLKSKRDEVHSYVAKHVPWMVSIIKAIE